MTAVLLFVAVLGLLALAAYVVIPALRTWAAIDLDDLTEDWEQREAADPQRSLKDRRLAGKARRRARRGR